MFRRINAMAVLFSVLTTGCYFSGEELREFLPKSAVRSTLQQSTRVDFKCAIAVFALGQESDVNLARDEILVNGFNLPPDDKIKDTSIAHRIISQGNSCWSKEIATSLKYPTLSEFMGGGKGVFTVKGGTLTILDFPSKKIVVVAG